MGRTGRTGSAGGMSALPAPGLIATLVGYFGLLLAVHKLQNSAWALPAVFALTGFKGYTLDPVLNRTLALPGGAQTIVLALAAMFLNMSALGLAASAMVALLLAGCGPVAQQPTWPTGGQLR